MPSVSEKTDRLRERTQCGHSEMSPTMKTSVLFGRSWVAAMCPALEATKQGILETEARE